MTTLYHISNEYQLLLDKEEYSADDMDKLNAINQDMREKAIQVAAYIMNKEAELNAIETARKAMKEREDKLDHKITYLREYLKHHLIQCNINEITDHAEFEVKIRTNPPKLNVTNELLIPKEFFAEKVELKLDKNAVKDAIKEGKIIPGAELVQESSLSIK